MIGKVGLAIFNAFRRDPIRAAKDFLRVLTILTAHHIEIFNRLKFLVIKIV